MDRLFEQNNWILGKITKRIINPPSSSPTFFKNILIGIESLQWVI